MLTLTNISKRYHDVTAISNVSIDIQEGQTTVLIGPSGCGKSTLLRMIIGLIEPDQGLVEFNKKSIYEDDLTAFRHHFGYVIQDGGLFPHLTASGNIILMARYLNWPENKIKTRLDYLRDLFQIDDGLLERFPLELSGGQQQRICIMRALMLDPEILLMDEPLGALDPMIRFDLQTELKQIFMDLHKTVVLVTHDIAEAAYFADRIVLLREGGVIQQGDINELLYKPVNSFVSDFISAQKSHWSLLEDKKQ